MTMDDVAGKTVLVTGGARGIGRAVVQAFAVAGANVVIADMRLEDAERTAREIGSCDCRRVVAVQTDVTKPEEINRLRDETLRNFGKIDVLVNCAGWDRLLPFLKTTPELWQKVMGVNFIGVANTCHAILPAMAERKQGAIVNISSDTGRV